jgi:hypothetical protein
MKRIIFMIIASILLSTTVTADLSAQSVEYVRICSLYGAGFYYIPGSDVCLMPTTGQTRQINGDGSTVIGQSQLAYRVTNLEHKLAQLEQKLASLKQNKS